MKGRTNSFFNRIRSAVMGDVADNIYAETAKRHRGDVEPNPTPSGEFPAVRLDEMILEYPVVQLD